MPGSIRRLPSGRYQVRIRQLDNGEFIGPISLGVFDTQVRAEQALAEFNDGHRIVTITAEDLVDAKAAARLLRYSPSYVRRLIDDRTFLEPFADLDIGPVWLREDVLEWKRNNPLKGW